MKLSVKLRLKRKQVAALRALVALGGELRARRLAVGLTQQALADAVGVTRYTVLRLEKGQSDVGAATLWAVLRVLSEAEARATRRATAASRRGVRSRS
jgi:transcriptional regulator with XRE-family HTH domain